MEFRGTVHGAAAREYDGFSYLRPVMQSVDIWQLDPERVFPTSEFPRFVNPPSQPNLETVQLADYVVKVGAVGSDGISTVQVWMQSNEYTAAKVPMLVFEFHVANAFVLRHEYCDEALRRAFGQ